MKCNEKNLVRKGWTREKPRKNSCISEERPIFSGIFCQHITNSNNKQHEEKKTFTQFSNFTHMYRHFSHVQLRICCCLSLVPTEEAKKKQSTTELELLSCVRRPNAKHMCCMLNNTFGVIYWTFLTLFTYFVCTFVYYSVDLFGLWLSFIYLFQIWTL